MEALLPGSRAPTSLAAADVQQIKMAQKNGVGLVME